MERFRRTLAYHEAGHALCHSLLGLGSGGASIVRDRPTHTLGRALHESRQEPFRPHKGMRGGFVVRVEVVAALAGAVAERLVSGGHDMDRCAEDLRQAGAMASQIAGSDHRAQRQYIAEATRTTAAFLTHNREALDALAAALLEREELSGAEVDCVVETEAGNWQTPGLFASARWR